MSEPDVLEQACTAHEESFLFPFYVSVDMDVEPIEAYCSAPSARSYLLESADKGGEARYSFVGTSPSALIELRGDHLIFKPLIKNELTRKIEETLGSVLSRDGTGYLMGERDALDCLRLVHPATSVPVEGYATKRQVFYGGLVGALCYEAAHSCWLRELVDEDVLYGVFMLTTSTMIFDHEKGEIYLVACELVHPDHPDEARVNAESQISKMRTLLRSAPYPKLKEPSVGKVREGTSRKEFEDMVRRAKQHVFDGDVFQVVISRRCSVPTDATPLSLYTSLRSINPSPYMYLLQLEGTAIIGASPERMLSVYDGVLTVNPIAGTCPRGSPEQDEVLAAEMMRDEKETAEHVMLVDLARNDTRMVCESGSVKVSEFMKVVKYSHVQHIESTVSGRLREGMDAFDATRAVFPAGTLSGAPKLRAMEIIHELEGTPRGFYGGGVGYVSLDGSADFAITIRTIVLEDGTAHVQAGAGIVADSVPEREYEETQSKMRAMLEAIHSRPIQKKVRV